MLLSFLSTLLVLSTQFHICFATGGNKGKESIDLNSSPYHDSRSDPSDGQLQTEQYQPSEAAQSKNHYRRPSKNTLEASERELCSFARRCMNRNEMTKEEWNQFRADHPKTAQEIKTAYKKQKADNQRLFRLRGRYANDPTNPQNSVDAIKYGFTEEEMKRRAHRRTGPGVNLKRIQHFMGRLRREINDIKNGLKRKRVPWSNLTDEQAQGPGVMTYLNNFRNLLRVNPYDPQLEPMKDHINQQLRSFYPRKFLELKLPFPQHGDFQEGHSDDGHSPSSDQKGGSSPHQTIPFPRQQNPFMAEYDNSQLHSNNLYPTPNHMNPGNYYLSDQVDPSSYHPNLNPNYFNHQQDQSQMDQNYAHLDSQMNYMQLDPHLRSHENTQDEDSHHQRHKFVRNFFHSDGEHEEDDYQGSEEE